MSGPLACPLARSQRPRGRKYRAMFKSPLHPFGWSDDVGPLHFLRSRWMVGPRWRRLIARFYASPVGVACQAHLMRTGYAVYGWFVDQAVWSDLSYFHKEQLVMGWIKSLRNPDGGAPRPADALDREWLSSWPALHEYLALTTCEDGSRRRTATLTLFVDGASWKVFLNEREHNASLCATGDSIAEAIGALEVMLEGSNPPWRFSDAPRPESGRPKRRGP